LIAPVKAQSHPLPLLKVENPSPALYQVWLTSEGEPPAGVDPYWDIQGIDVYMYFNKDALTAVPYSPSSPLNLNKAGWKVFWPNPLTLAPTTTLVNEINNAKGYVRAAFVGLPLTGGAHTPPNGKILMFSAIFTVDDPLLPPDVKLKNPDPRPVVPPWGQESFPVAVSGFAHPERPESPWNGAPWAVPIPHFVSNPNARFLVSDAIPKKDKIVYFDASISHHPSFIESYEWDLNGDGTVDATGMTPTYSYSTRGMYKVTLKVTDLTGLTDTASRTIAVEVFRVAKAEHTVQDMSDDPDNTITITMVNNGIITGLVKLKVDIFNRRTGMRPMPPLEAIGALPVSTPPETTDLSVVFTPPDPATYDLTVECFYFDDYTETWEPLREYKLGTLKLVIKAVP